MANFIMKSSSPRRAVNDTARDPMYQKGITKGRARLERVRAKSENEAQFRDYEKAVKSNPNNVMGYPPMFPPEKIREFMFNPAKQEEAVAYLSTCKGCRNKFSVTPEEWQQKEYHCESCLTKN